MTTYVHVPEQQSGERDPKTGTGNLRTVLFPPLLCKDGGQDLPGRAGLEASVELAELAATPGSAG